MNHIMTEAENAKLNLNLPINERLTLAQRNALVEYDNKMSFLDSIHEELRVSGKLTPMNVDGVIARNNLEFYPEEVKPYKHIAPPLEIEA